MGEREGIAVSFQWVDRCCAGMIHGRGKIQNPGGDGTAGLSPIYSPRRRRDRREEKELNELNVTLRALSADDMLRTPHSSPSPVFTASSAPLRGVLNFPG